MKENRKEVLVKLIDKELAENKDKYNKYYRLESQLQTRIITVLKRIFKEDIWFTKVSDKYIKGIPDIIGCVAGKFFAMELKTEKGKPSDLQVYNINKITKAGGTVCIVRTVEESLMTIKSTLMT